MSFTFSPLFFFRSAKIDVKYIDDVLSEISVENRHMFNDRNVASYIINSFITRKNSSWEWGGGSKELHVQQPHMHIDRYCSFFLFYSIYIIWQAEKESEMITKYET